MSRGLGKLRRLCHRSRPRSGLITIQDRSVLELARHHHRLMVDVSRPRIRPHNTVRIPTEHVALVADLHRRFGPRSAAKQLRLGRAAMLTVLATGEASPGTAALLREALARRGTQA